MIVNSSLITSAPRDIMLIFLKSYFATNDEYYWSEDPKQRKIVIADAFSATQEDIERLPHIVVQRSSMAVIVKGLSNNLHKKDFFSGTKEHFYPFQCNLRIHCLAQNGLVAEKIASDVVCAVFAGKDLLRRVGFQSIDLQQIGMEEPLELSGTTVHVANVSIDFMTTFVLKLSIRIPEDRMSKLSSIFIRSIQRWTETGERLINMEVK